MTGREAAEVFYDLDRFQRLRRGPGADPEDAVRAGGVRNLDTTGKKAPEGALRRLGKAGGGAV